MGRASLNLPHCWPLHAPSKFPLKWPIEQQACCQQALTVTKQLENSFTFSRVSKAPREKQLPSCCSKHWSRKKKMKSAMMERQNADFCRPLKTQIEDPRSKNGDFYFTPGSH